MNKLNEDYRDPTGMERLILAIISNETLWSHIPTEKVFDRAVHLRNNANKKKPKLEGSKLEDEKKKFEQDIGECENAMEMEQLKDFKESTILKSFIF